MGKVENNENSPFSIKDCFDDFDNLDDQPLIFSSGEVFTYPDLANLIVSLGDSLLENINDARKNVKEEEKEIADSSRFYHFLFSYMSVVILRTLLDLFISFDAIKNIEDKLVEIERNTKIEGIEEFWLIARWLSKTNALLDRNIFKFFPKMSKKARDDNAKILKLSDISSEGVPSNDNMLAIHEVELISSHIWTVSSLKNLLQWVLMILSPKNHRGKTYPFFVYIEDNLPENLPRFYDYSGQWVSGFGGRLVVPMGALKLSATNKAELWDTLFQLGIYGEKLDHSVREPIFETIGSGISSLVANKDEERDYYHLDLCGGEGYFIEWLREQGDFNSLNSFLMDISHNAVETSTKKDIEAFVGDAEADIGLGSKMDVVTLIFAIQWLSPNALKKIFNVLKPEGICLGNIYPPIEEAVQVFNDFFIEAGFVEIKITKIDAAGKDQYIFSAKKPKDNNC